MTSRNALGTTVAVVLALAGCSKDSSPTAPMAFDPAGTNQSVLTAVVGSGTGGVSVTPLAVSGGFFTADIKVRLHGTKPNSIYTVQRAPEIGRALGSDGVCQRALGISPWSPSDPPAPAFVTFNQPGTTTAYTVTSSAAGEATLDFTFSAPSVPTGTRFDVMFRLMDDLVTPTSLFMSGCFTVTVL